MNPAFSIIFFTTLSGTAQGLVLVLAASCLAGAEVGQAFLASSLWASGALLVLSLASSFFHLGHPMRAWRAALMWRTSWMSREVIVLPVFIALVLGWSLALPVASLQIWFQFAAIAGALLLWLCTAMIYVCIRFIQEWAHPITVANYTLIGLSSGLVLAGALAILLGERSFARELVLPTIAITAIAWSVRCVSLARNNRIKPKSTLQSATGIHAKRLVQKSMGMTGGSFNTREFFCGVGAATVKRIKAGFQVMAFLIPMACVALAQMPGWEAGWLVAVPIQYLGVVAERWLFFAQANHPQNLYYQVVS